MHTRQKHYLTFHSHWTVILNRACTCDQTIAFSAADDAQLLQCLWIGNDVNVHKIHA